LTSNQSKSCSKLYIPFARYMKAIKSFLQKTTLSKQKTTSITLCTLFTWWPQEVALDERTLSSKRIDFLTYGRDPQYTLLLPSQEDFKEEMSIFEITSTKISQQIGWLWPKELKANYFPFITKLLKIANVCRQIVSFIGSTTF